MNEARRAALEDLFYAMAHAERVAEDKTSSDDAVVESVRVVRTKMTACREAGVDALNEGKKGEKK